MVKYLIACYEARSHAHQLLMNRRRSAGGAGSTPIAPPSGRFTGMSSNMQQATPASGQEGTPPKANPFANISFAPTAPTPAKASFSFRATAPAATAPTPSKASFSFGAAAPAATAPTPSKPLFGAPPSAVKPKAPSNGFSFAGSKPAVPSFSLAESTKESDSAASKDLFSSKTDVPKAALPRFASPAASKFGPINKRVKELNTGFFQWIKAAWEAGYRAEDWSSSFAVYEAKIKAIEAEIEPEDDNAPAAESSNNVITPAASPPATQPAFSFRAPAPAPTAKSEAPKPLFGGSSAPAPPAPSTSFSFRGAPSSATTAPSAGSFSFGFGASAPAPAPEAPKQSFSFGSIPPPSNPTTSNNGTNDDDDPTANPDDGKIEEVEQEKNEEEDVLFEIKAKPMKSVDGEWKKYGAGVCRLYKHKTTKKHRIVTRNTIGKVQFNVSISADMKPFDKVLKDGKKGKLAFIKFSGMESAAEGVRVMMLQVTPEEIDRFHSILNGIEE